MANISKIQLPGGTIYTIVDRAGRAMIAGDFSTSTAYQIGDYVIYNDKLYVFTAAHPAGAWNSDHVTQTTSADEFKKLKNTISGGVHYIGVTTTPIYDGYTSPSITINGSAVIAGQGDLVILDLNGEGVCTRITSTSYPVQVSENVYYKVIGTG